MTIKLSMKYHVYQRAGLWFVRRKQKDGNGWRDAGKGVLFAAFDLRAVWRVIEQDIDLRAAAKRRNAARAKGEAIPVAAAGSPSRAKGGRFHGADC